MQKNNRLKRTWRTLFTRKGDHGGTQNYHAPLQTASPRAKLYTSITTLPLSLYKRAEIHNDLQALIIEGPPDIRELIEAWSTIKLEYAEAMGGAETKAYTQAFVTFLQHQHDYDACVFLIDLLKNTYATPLETELNALLRTELHLNPHDREDYFKKLKKASFSAKEYKVRAAEAKSRLKKLAQKHEEGGKVDEEYFQTMLIELSNHAKYQITDNISTFEYCKRVKDLVKHNDMLKRSLKHAKR